MIIADTHQHHVVIADLAGQVTQVIGTGEAVCANRACQDSQFRHPEGVAVDSNFVYMAEMGIT